MVHPWFPKYIKLILVEYLPARQSRHLAYYDDLFVTAQASKEICPSLRLSSYICSYNEFPLQLSSIADVRCPDAQSKNPGR